MCVCVCVCVCVCGPYFTPGKLATICPMNLARKRMEQELSVSKDAAVLKMFFFFLSHKSDGHVY